MLYEIVCGDLHSQRPVGKASECFPVEKVPPSAQDLADQQPRHRNIRQFEKFYFLHSAEDDHHNDRSNNPSINGKASAPGIQYLRQMIFVVIPGKNNIVKSRPNDSRNHHRDDEIKDQIRIDSVFLSHSGRRKHPQKKSQCNDYTVIFDLKSSDADALSHMFEHNAQKWKPDFIFHNRITPFRRFILSHFSFLFKVLMVDLLYQCPWITGLYLCKDMKKGMNTQ